MYGNQYDNPKGAREKWIVHKIIRTYIYILVSNPTYRLPFYTLPINRLPPLDCHQKNVSEFSKEKKITITHQFVFCITKMTDLLNAPTLNRR